MMANTLCSWELFAGFTLTHLSWWEQERILHKTFRRQREAGKREKKRVEGGKNRWTDERGGEREQCDGGGQRRCFYLVPGGTEW